MKRIFLMTTMSMVTMLSFSQEKIASIVSVSVSLNPVQYNPRSEYWKGSDVCEMSSYGKSYSVDMECTLNEEMGIGITYTKFRNTNEVTRSSSDMFLVGGLLDIFSLATSGTTYGMTPTHYNQEVESSSYGVSVSGIYEDAVSEVFTIGVESGLGFRRYNRTISEKVTKGVEVIKNESFFTNETRLAVHALLRLRYNVSESLSLVSKLGLSSRPLSVGVLMSF